MSTTRAAQVRTLLATITGSTMIYIDSSVVNVALPVLQDDLDASLTDVQWVVEAYILFLSALTLAGGALGDRYGRRRFFALGVILFALASIACALADSPAALIAGRCLQGLGGALLTPGGMALISASFPGAQRSRAIGLWIGASAIAVAAGPVLGGWAIEALSWRWIFWLNLPFCLVTLIALAGVPESRRESAGPLDWPGALAATAALGGITFGLLESPRLGFTSPLVWLPLVAGLLLLPLFAQIERRARDPLVPPGLLANRPFVAVQIVTLVFWATIQTTFFFLPFNLMQLQGYAPLEAGLAILPAIVMISLMARLSARVMERAGPRPPVLTGILCAAAGLALLARPGLETVYWRDFFPAIALFGLGVGLNVTPITALALSTAEERLAGTASAINNAASRIGGLLAIALFGLILALLFRHRLDTALAGLPLDAAERAAIAAERLKLAAMALPEGWEERLRPLVRQAYLDGYRWVMGLAAAQALVALVLAWRLIGPAPPGSHPPGAPTAGGRIP